MSSAARYTPELLSEAVALSRKGWTHARIAAHQGVARETVTRHLGAHFRAALAELRADQSAILGEQADQILELIYQAWREWARSRRDATATSSTREGQELSDVARAEDGTVRVRETIEVWEADIARVQKTEGRLGDPRYLREIRELMAEYRKLLAVEPDAADARGEQAPRIAIPDRDDRVETETDGGPGLDPGGRPPEA